MMGHLNYQFLSSLFSKAKTELKQFEKMVDVIIKDKKQPEANKLHHQALLLDINKVITALERVLSIHKDSIPEVTCAAIKAFLSERDKDATLTDLGYTAEPGSISNKLCQDIGELVYFYELEQGIISAETPKNCALYKILMPSLNITSIYTPLVGDEAIGDLPDLGKFLLSDALIKTQNGPIISFPLVVDYAKQHLYFFAIMLSMNNTAVLLESLPPKEKRAFEKIQRSTLMPSEQSRLRHFSPAGKTFFEDLDSQLFHLINNATLGEQLNVLAKGLFMGSSHTNEEGIRGNAVDDWASSEATEAITVFMAYWERLLKSLPTEEDRTKIKNLKGTCFQAITIETMATRFRDLKNDGRCTGIGSGLMESIVKNSANKVLLQVRPNPLKNGQVQLPPLPDSAKAAEVVNDGRDHLGSYPASILDELLKIVDSLRACTIRINGFSTATIVSSGILDRFLQYLNTFPVQERATKLSNALYELSEEAKPVVIKFLLLHIATWPMTVAQLNGMLRKLAPTEIRTILSVSIKSIQMNNSQFTSYEDIKTSLLIFLTPEQTEAALSKMAYLIRSIINNCDRLIAAIQYQNANYAAENTAEIEFLLGNLFSDNNPNKKNIIPNVQEAKKLFEHISHDKLAITYQIVISDMITRGALASTDDIKNLLQYPFAIEQLLWVVDALKEQLLAIFKDAAAIALQILHFPTHTQAIIINSVIDFLPERMDSINAFIDIFLVISQDQRDGLYERLSVERKSQNTNASSSSSSSAVSNNKLIRLILEAKNPLQAFTTVYCYLNAKNQSNLYDRMQYFYCSNENFFSNNINTVHNLYQALMVLNERDRDELLILLSHQDAAGSIKLATILSTASWGDFKKLFNLPRLTLAQFAIMLQHKKSLYDFSGPSASQVFYDLMFGKNDRKTVIYTAFSAELPGVIQFEGTEACGRILLVLTPAQRQKVYTLELIEKIGKTAQGMAVLFQHSGSDKEILIALRKALVKNLLNIFPMIDSLDILTTMMNEKDQYKNGYNLMFSILNKFIAEDFIPVYKSLIPANSFDRWLDALEAKSNIGRIKCLWHALDQGDTLNKCATAVWRQLTDQPVFTNHMSINSSSSSSSYGYWTKEDRVEEKQFIQSQKPAYGTLNK